MLTFADIALQGTLAGAAGKSMDDCPYRRAERRSAWVRGWHAGRDQPRGELVRTRFSPAERRRGRAALAQVREALSRPARAAIDGECSGDDGHVG